MRIRKIHTHAARYWKKACSIALAGILCMGMAANVGVRHINAEDTTDTGVDQIPGTVRTESELDGSFLSATGFAAAGVNDRSEYGPEDEAYAVVTNEEEFLEAVGAARAGLVKVIDIRADLNLGWLELSQTAKTLYGNVIEQYANSDKLAYTPVGNPVLIESGISILTIDDVDGLTIFSPTGNTIKHAEIKLNSNCNDVVIRNLRFDEMWEWDDWRESGFGSTGGKGNHKRTGWTFIKVNGAKNVWIDHCTFGIAADGNVDLENGASNVTLSWCEFGDVDHEVGSMIYKTAMYLEEIYQQSKVEGSGVSSFVIYGIMRDNGMTVEQVMEYMSYHSKCHLNGAGDKDTWLVKDSEGNVVADTTKTNANELIRVTFAYNHYTNMGSRVPMIRSGVANLYNCYMEAMRFNEILKVLNSDPMKKGSTIRKQIEAVSGTVVTSTRCIDARNGASVGADTCVFYGVEAPLTGTEHQQDDLNNMPEPAYHRYWTWNHALIVNSSTTKIADADKDNPYIGSSWDNKGSNPFTKGYNWRDGSTIGNWSWGEEGDELPYEYQTFPLEDVKDNVNTYSGAYKVDMSAEDWLKTEYDEQFEIVPADTDTPVPIESVSLDKETWILYTDEFLQLDVGKMPLNTTEKEATFTWTSSNEDVATVSDCGLVVPVTRGSATITVTTAGQKTASCEVTVSQTPTKVVIKNVPEAMYVGDIYQFRADVEPGDLIDESVVWESLGSRIEVRDNVKGIMEAITAGNNQISVTANMVGNRIGSLPVSAKQTITVKATPVYVDGVELDQSINVKKGETAALTANVLPEDATNKNVTWTVADDSVVTVDENGVITGLKEGSTAVTVTTINKGFMATCEVTVTDDGTPLILVEGVELDESEISIKEGTYETLTATILPADATNKGMTWTVADESVAKGAIAPGSTNLFTVQGLKKGTTTVTVTTVDGGFTATCEVIVSGKITKGDVNGDGEVKLYDAQMALRAALNIIELTTEQHEAADVNDDGDIKLNDAQMILRAALNIVSLE